MIQRDYCQVYIRGFVEEINKVTHFIEESQCGFSSERECTQAEKEKGYIIKQIGEDLFDVELLKLQLASQIIEEFPLLRITGLCETWERGFNRVDSFYSESGTDKIKYDFAGVFDGESDCSESRWAWYCDLFVGCKGSIRFVQTGEIERYNFRYPYTREWWAKTFARNINNQIVKKHGRYSESTANRFVIENNVLINYVGSGDTVAIPNNVNAIASLAFEKHPYIKTVVIPEYVRNIGNNAFRECDQLASVIICGNTSLDHSLVFKGCKKLVWMVDPFNSPQLIKSPSIQRAAAIGFCFIKIDTKMMPSSRNIKRLFANRRQRLYKAYWI